MASTAPSITIRKLDSLYCEFLLEGTDVSIANALRRVIIAEVPSVAIELVEIESYVQLAAALLSTRAVPRSRIRLSAYH